MMLPVVVLLAGDDEEEASFQGLGLGDELSLNFLRFLTLKRPKS